MKTQMKPTSQETTHKLDATNKVLGRFAVEIANLLRGKDKPDFVEHVVMGDRVIVTNAEKIKITGRKMYQKTYFRHSGYLGGTTFEPLKTVFDNNPEEVIRRAVSGMLPKNRLQKLWLKKLTFESSNKENGEN